MRNSFTAAMVDLCTQEDFCFLTGDLGFNALEPLQKALGDRFFNTGIAEQSTVSISAGMARNGLRPWVYSIAPFCYARPFEQIRNDICFNNLPVRLVGNGAGFGYGVQGPSHHAIEDCGVMSSLRNMRSYAPAFDSDLKALTTYLQTANFPAYIRLGIDEGPKDIARPAFEPWRKLCDGDKGILIAFGAIGGTLWDIVLAMPEQQRPAVWVCCELPLLELPASLKTDIAKTDYVLVVEEHVAEGGLGCALARDLLLNGIAVKKFIHRCVKGYVSGKYGSQKFHRAENEIDRDSLTHLISSLS